MRRLALACLLLAVAGSASAQHYADFDACGYDRGLNNVNGLRVYFDPAVPTGCAGTLASPGFYAWAPAQQVAVYLVLTHPTAATLQSWQCDFTMDGVGLVLATTYYGGTYLETGTGDTHVVDMMVPTPLGATHVPLMRFDVLLSSTSMQPGQTFDLVEFYLRAAGGRTEVAPGYVDGDGAFTPCASFTSPYNGWDVPCMMLNDNTGVTEGEAETWSELKALYR
ncbi:MAG: hypothetical protein GY838_02760 [bacterium]|nr:hypothetical protein [bacterium]